MNEKDQKTSPEQRDINVELEASADRQYEKIREAVENKSERSPESNKESLSESLEKAHELARESERSTQEHDDNELEKHESAPPISPRAKRKEAYDHTMSEVRGHLTPASRAFSKVIHNPAVETVSEAAGKTVARPNAVLGGSMTAFFVVLAVFLIARHYGYPLSGSETILAFAAGWVLGIIFDYMRVMITGRR